MSNIIEKILSNNTNDAKARLWMDEPLTKIDRNWLKNSYLINVNDLAEDDQPNMYWSNAYLKFVDTSLGGNFGINTKYGFTPSADVPIAGRLAGREEYDSLSETMNFGMGRRYSDMFDDNEQILYIELGDARFNSMISYVVNAIDYGTSVVANTGRSLAAYYAGKAIGTIIGVTALFMAFPIYGAALFLAFAGAMWFMSLGSDFKYYYMKSSMHKYWKAVNIMATTLGVEMGLLPPSFQPKAENSTDLGMPMKITTEFSEEINNHIPGLIAKEGYIDVFAVANKTQVLINAQKSIEREYYNQAGEDGELPKVFTYADKIASIEARSFASYIDELFKLGPKVDLTVDDTATEQTDNKGAIEAIEDKQEEAKTISRPKPKSVINEDESITLSPKEVEEKKTWWNSFFEYTNASARHGANFASFRVEYTGAVSESFSNSVGEIPIKDTINSVSSKARQVMFSAAGGNILGDTFKKVMDTTVDALAGAISGVTFGLGDSLLAALMGGGYYDVPKMWTDSSFEYQKHTFKMRLTGPYGHPLSLMQDIGLPVVMLICAIASQSVGKAGYTSPMLCSPFIKGIMNPEMAIMDSLTIERGTGNMAFDKNWRPLSVDVSFSFIDLSGLVTMPVQAGLLAPIRAALDDSSPTSRYMQLFAGRDLYTTKYAMPKAKLRYMKLKQNVDMMTNPSYWGTMVGTSLSNGVFGAMVEGYSLPRGQKN